jgi:hypothetical protein
MVEDRETAIYDEIIGFAGQVSKSVSRAAAKDALVEALAMALTLLSRHGVDGGSSSVQDGVRREAAAVVGQP